MHSKYSIDRNFDGKAQWPRIRPFEPRFTKVFHSTAIAGLMLCCVLTVFGQANTPIAPELSGLGTIHMPVTTSVPRAQAFFDQGLRLAYAFNHQEARRAFQEAARLDPKLAMAYWGQALTLGPTINSPMTEESGRRAQQAIKAAQALAANASPRERELIEALATRHSGVTDSPAQDNAYAEAMSRVATHEANDPDIQTLYADAVMNTMRWDYWQKDGRPKPATEKILATLESVIAKFPDHAGAHHFYIHAVEASDNPDRGVASADRLGLLMPAAGHMVHMPAHIYIRVGRYADASEATQRATLADEDYLAQCQAQGLYPVSYYPHNVHFLWATATLEGRSAVAIDAARKVAVKTPHHHAGALGWTADFPVTPLLAYVRFGRWKEILTEVSPPANEPYAIGIWHYARAMAFIGRKQNDRAQGELRELKATMTHEAFATRFKDLPLLTNLQIAARIVEGDLAAANGRREEAIRFLQEAVELEDGLAYNEPPTWHHPPRQILGAVLLESGRPGEAEQVYRQDLKRFRDNGWSLFGLSQSLEAQNRKSEAADVRERFGRAWARADIKLTSSRILNSNEKASALRSESGFHSSLSQAVPQVRSIKLVNRVKLEYVEQGDPHGVPILFLHGYTDSWLSYGTVLPRLPKTVHTFALSLRGHGGSERPMSGYHPQDFADDVAAFMDAHELRSAVIVGHSMGGTVAQRFAASYPERTLALVLVGTAATWRGNPVVEELWEAAVSKLTNPVDVNFVREFQQSTVAQPVPAAFLQTMVEESLKVPARIWKSVLEGLLATDLSMDLRTIRVPTLIVWGDQDTIAPKSQQDLLLASISKSKLGVYAGAGHGVHWEEPDRFASDLLTFVETRLSAR